MYGKTLDELVAFLHARLDEDARDSGLFHELTCPHSGALARPAHCACPAPAALLDLVWIKERVVGRYEQRLALERAAGLVWPVDSILVFAGLKAMALTYELHPGWQDDWYP